MPDDTGDAAAGSEKKSAAVNPDRVGEELADDAHIWHVYDRVAKEDDERRTKAWDTGLNNLALFAGLFSAVTTAFIIEAQQDMKPDYAELTFLVLNASAAGGHFVQKPFVVPPGARIINCLWISSLILSLSAALIAIMGKDWIGLYTARPVCNLRQWAEMRTYRLLCVERWYMSGVIAAAPVLLHVSLLLFGAGLVLFMSSDPLTLHLALGLSLAAGSLYLIITLSAVVFSASPFKSPATQMIRATLSASYSYFCSIIYRPKSNSLRTLVCGIHATVLRRADDTAFLPGGLVENRPWYAGLCSAIVTTSGAAVACMRKIPSWVYTVHSNLHWSSVQSHVRSIASVARRLSFNLFLSTTWTDLPTDRRPKLLAEALSWLSSASQSPDIFRAVVFALGDLDIGPQVGKHASLALCTRLKAEIRRTWQQADFLTLSRYVLADRNTLTDPALHYFQFKRRLTVLKESALRCDDGLAAVILIDSRDIWPSDVVEYSPDQVAQPRMLEFLVPHIQQPQKCLTDVLILLANRYRTHLWTTNSFNLGNLEVHVYQSLDTERRDAYTAAVNVQYGGTAGVIELLTFLCCHYAIQDATKAAAVELIMELLERLPVREHRCLAYLFGSNKLWAAAWKDRCWSPWSLYRLSTSLQISCAHPFEPSSVRTLSDDQQFDLALARTAAMILSPQLSTFVCERNWIEFLHGHLHRSQPLSSPDNSEVITLILKSAALLKIAGTPDNFGHIDNAVSWGPAILAATMSDAGSKLRDPATIHDGEQLFEALARTEVKGPDGETCVWDLGEWLRTRAIENLWKSPSVTAAMRDIYEGLGAIYPLCAHNHELRAIWDRVGYSDPPDEYFCDPFLDLDDFIASDEDPLARSGI